MLRHTHTHTAVIIKHTLRSRLNIAPLCLCHHPVKNQIPLSWFYSFIMLM